ncbi:sulfurtransferase [Nesterenkonia populi]|uniref:sulfurtransferase n=1 Tax=Nesterenkonia populi TaxID=1591087 RepID=UPI0011BE636B|nr:sulfurtransferase [Nesterenkonia populi]
MAPQNTPTSPLISAEELDARLGDPQVKILDVRWRQDRPEGMPEYLQGHIPGAVFVDLDYELADPEAANNGHGRHPLPVLEEFQATVQRWGVNNGDTIIVYDDLKNLSSARAWWLLRWAGFGDVRILDGSLRAWTGTGRAVADGLEMPDFGDAHITPQQMPLLEADDVVGFAQRATLLDARPADRYTGEYDPLSPRPGHIPGAISAPAVGSLDSSGRFLPPQQLRERYLRLGVDPERPVAAYCTSGLHSAHSVIALQLAGFQALLYPAGFSQWTRDEARRVVVGTHP